MKPSEVIFEVREASEGGYDARALGHSIFTQGDDWEDLKAMAREAFLCHLGRATIGFAHIAFIHWNRAKNVTQTEGRN